MKYRKALQGGFTLIELLITVALLAILLAMVGSLTGGWIDRAQAQGAQSNLKAAISRARAAAIRNPENRSANAAAASACIDSTALTITVYQITGANTACDAGNTLLRTATYAAGVGFSQAGASVSCFVFSPNGIVIASGSCATTLETITIKKNNEEEVIDAI